MHDLAGRAGSLLIAVATALLILAVTMPLFLNPWWVSTEQGRAEATAWTGYSETELRATTDAILADLVFGPPTFDVEVAGAPVLIERERAHMRDVRGVFVGFLAAAAVLGVGAAVVTARRRDPVGRHRSWRAARAGAIGLIAALVAGGLVSLTAFDALFETFHQLFFAGGSYTFDPATERLVQLFPFTFWQETAMALGVVAIVIAAIVSVVATRRAARALAAGLPAEPVGVVGPSSAAHTPSAAE